MPKKSKELELAGLRIQIDPIILIRRIIGRQKLVLAGIALLGMVVTGGVYLRTPKKYTSTAEVVIRTETFQSDYLRNFLNLVARFIHSDTEMMIIINELNLYPQIRANMPYEMALRAMRRELKIDRPGSILISFQSTNPEEAQRVVAFVTERLMTKLADLKDSPYRQQLDAISTGLDDMRPRLKAAQLELYEFKQKHPEIALRNPLLGPVGSPSNPAQDELSRAQREMGRCLSGAPASLVPERASGPMCTRLAQAEAQRDELLSQFTSNHPSVIAAENEVKKARPACERESGSAAEVRAPISQEECLAAARAKIARISGRKAELDRGASKQPKLEGRWAELNLEVSALDTEYMAFRESYRKIVKERLLAANEFRDTFVLVDPPRVPELPSYPDRTQFGMIGGAITAILGITLALAREALRQTFVEADEVEEQTGVPVLACLPNIPDRSR